jgi:hypothetical protein
MSGRGLEFISSWVVYLNHGEANPLTASRATIRAECVAAAESEGISASEIEEEVGDIPDFLFNEIAKAERAALARISAAQLSNEQQRRLRRKHVGFALLRALATTLVFAVVVYVSTSFNGASFAELTGSNSAFFLLVLVGSFWAHYRWLNYQAGIGREASDPNLNEGP